MFVMIEIKGKSYGRKDESRKKPNPIKRQVGGNGW